MLLSEPPGKPPGSILRCKAHHTVGLFQIVENARQVIGFTHVGDCLEMPACVGVQLSRFNEHVRLAAGVYNGEGKHHWVVRDIAATNIE